MSLREETFGKMADGREVRNLILKNKNGLTASVITYGGIVTELRVPDKRGEISNVVLGFESLEAYLKGHPYFGAITGRYANRIARGQFELDGQVYGLAINNGPNHLHGGLVGFDKALWEVKTVEAGQNDAGVELRHLSPDGDEGYPGNLDISVFYRLTENNELRIDYQAQTDKATPLNLTNHSYFNMAGSGSVYDHLVQLAAPFFTAVDKELIPTGEILSVKNTPLDFLEPKSIGSRIQQVIPEAGGYDHNFVLNGKTEITLAARVQEPKSGRKMEVHTSEPGIQLYTGNFLDGSLTGRGGVNYGRHQAFCLETQHFPDSPNHRHFPSTILRAGTTFKSTTIYKFSVDA